MTNKQCKRCGKVNPAEIHTCTPEYVNHRQWIYDPMTGQRLDEMHLEQDPTINGWPLYSGIPKPNQKPVRDFNFSTIEEAMQPMPATAVRHQLTDDEERFANAFSTLIKAGYEKEAKTMLKCKSTWQGLAGEDWIIGKRNADYIAGAEWAEAKLKDKNNG